jgi:glycerophosphoryl diester phosphodiesterase
MKKTILVLAIALVAACNSQKKTAVALPGTFDKQGHRGCRGLMPENTIPAMLKALELGVTTLEMDVVISKDNKVVVSHDVFFHQNITTTPEGGQLTKAEAEKRLLYTMNYDSIKKYDVGLKAHPDYPRQEKIAVHKPLLSDLVDASETFAKQKGRNHEYNIEIKSKPENDGKKHPPVEVFADLLMKVINDKGLTDRTVVQSFDPRALQAVHKKYPSVRTSLLIEGNDKRSLEEQLQQLGYTPVVYSPHFSLVNAALISKCREKNIKVIPWTVNNTDEMRRLLQLGVDGIISDYPDLFSQL